MPKHLSKRKNGVNQTLFLLVLKQYSSEAEKNSLRFYFQDALMIFRYPSSLNGNEVMMHRLCNFIANDLANNVYNIKKDKNVYYIGLIDDKFQFVEKHIFVYVEFDNNTNIITNNK